MKKKRILLSFSGGLDTSAILPWLRETQDAEVVAFCADLGNAPVAAELGQWAKTLGAVDFIFEDLREQFVSDFVFPALKAGAIYQNEYLLGTALGRPLIAERLVHWAKDRGCTAIAHGATGKGNDQLRIENGIAFLAPEMQIVAPWRTWSFQSRTDLRNYLADKGFAIDRKEKVYSEDVNLFHRSCEGGILEDPSQEYSPEDVLKWAKIKEPAISSTKVEIAFKHGIPVQIDGKKLPSHEILMALNQLGGRYGFGVADVVEERKIGFKSRGIYETPGGTILFDSIRQLKHLCWDRDLLNIANSLSTKYADLVYDGMWHTDAKNAIDSFFNHASRFLTGTVAMEISTNGLRFLSRQSPYSLMQTDLSSFESDKAQLNRHSEGFCKIGGYKQSLMGKRAAMMKEKSSLQS
jgi:argininosuccinate synthase